MKYFTITLTETQLQSLVGLIDAGVRATGLRAVQEAAELLPILQNAEPNEEKPDGDL